MKSKLIQPSSSKDLNKIEKKTNETPLKSTRTNSQKARNASSLSPSTQINLKDGGRFLNPIEEILPKGVVNLNKKKIQKKVPTKVPIRASQEKEKLESGMIFIAKNMKIVEDKMKIKENLKKKEPVFMSQTQTIFKVFF